ncbi:SDR family NAD(P)-dependent oxidoreductase [Iodobacter sp. BJB302]|uniref:SDR family NAD(P)-dependent oxidoreductase n=1 Tax=Iodobacter sp. BJB302 TaxID=1506510 RepID=UPI000C0E787F|nr:SDR family NAD(P)-dependent oxidoreductase [Iodobacter sp. BJB302]PHU99499.1 hypothetical protein CSQ88_22200 [Iodobacter sp. BJB302]
MNPKKIVLVTGGSRGIGAAAAKLFAKNGYSVCINYKSNEVAALKTAQEILEFGGTCITVQADVSNEKDVINLFSTIDQKLGHISVLVNNAGILKKQTRLEELTAERINEVFTTNVTGYFLCCREAVKRMSFKNGGSGGAIVNVSSGNCQDS